MIKWPIFLNWRNYFLPYKDQAFKVDVLTGNSVSNSKFQFIYRFSGENGKSLALYICRNVVGNFGKVFNLATW